MTLYFIKMDDRVLTLKADFSGRDVEFRWSALSSSFVDSLITRIMFPAHLVVEKLPLRTKTFFS